LTDTLSPNNYRAPLIIGILIQMQEANKIKPFLFYWLEKKIAYGLKEIPFSKNTVFVQKNSF
jgi:hypothetical protein